MMAFIPIRFTRISSTKRSSRHSGKIHGKGDTDQHVDAGFFDQFRFLLDQRDQGRMTVLGDHPDGMGFEGHGNGRSVHGIGHFDHLVKKGLVAEVNTVEIANGNHGGFERFFYGFDILYYFHDLSVNRKIEPGPFLCNVGVDTKNKKI
jgi:hypothetical protein